MTDRLSVDASLFWTQTDMGTTERPCEREILLQKSPKHLDYEHLEKRETQFPPPNGFTLLVPDFAKFYVTLEQDCATKLL